MSPPSVSGVLFATFLSMASLRPAMAVEFASASTPPVGLATLTLPGAATAGATRTSLRGLGITQPVAFQGTAEAAGTNTLTDAESTWAEGALDAAAGQPLYFVEIIRPPGELAAVPGEGTTYDILTSTAAAPAAGAARTLTLAQPLAVGVPGTNRIAYRIRKHWTLGSVFGAANEAGLLAGTPTTADVVQIFDPTTQAYACYYFSTGAGAAWRDTVSGAIATQRVIYPEDGLVIRRRGTSEVQISLLGAAKPGPTTIPIVPGTNVLANSYPCALTLGSSGLLESGFAPNDGAGGDDLLLHDGTKYVLYQYRTGGTSQPGWRNVATGALEDPTIPLGAGLVIKRKSAAGFEWKLPAYPGS